MEEQWKEIPGYDGDYLVSNLGRVKSKKSWGKERILKPSMNTKKYLIVGLSKNGESKTKLVHRLVGNQFIDNPEEKRCINHKNGIKYDNRAENLEWVTYQENTDHAIGNGLFDNKGENYGASKLTGFKVQKIRKLYKLDKKNQYELADMFNVSRPTITSLINRKTWKHLPVVKVEKESKRDQMKRRMHPNRDIK